MSITTKTEIPVLRPASGPEGDHALLRRFASASPVARTSVGSYLVLRAADIRWMVEDGRTRQLETELLELQGITSGPIYDLVASSMLFANDDVHARRRRPVVKTFAFKFMQALRGDIARLTERVIVAHRGEGPMDFLGEVATRVPIAAIGQVLGLPPAELPRFGRAAQLAVQGIGLHPPERRAEIEAAMEELRRYAAFLIDRARQDTASGFVADFVATTDGIFDESEQVGQLVLLVLAGADTTRVSIASTLSQLLQNRDQWDALCSDPDGLLKPAVEEGLRFDPAVAGLPRVAERDLHFEDCTIPAGSVTSGSILAALRDPAVYENPGQFDIHRTDHPRWSLAFGLGAHRCLGEALARVEIEEVIGTIARLAPGTILWGAAPELRGCSGVRQIDRMEVVFY